MFRQLIKALPKAAIRPRTLRLTQALVNVSGRTRASIATAAASAVQRIEKSNVSGTVVRSLSTKVSPDDDKVGEIEKALALKRLDNVGLLPPDMNSAAFKDRLNSVKIYYNAQKYPEDKLEGDKAFTLQRAITKVVPVDVGASYHGETLDGSDWPGADYYMSLKPGDVNGLSPEERVLARNKIIASKARIYAYGGFPAFAPVIALAKPKDIHLFTLAGLQFEHPLLDYRLCIIDQFQDPIRYKKICDEMAVLPKSEKARYSFLQSDLSFYICRDSTGEFSPGLNGNKNNAVIFDRQKYFDTLVDDFTMAFASAENLVEGSKPIYFKVPLIGLGFFASVNGQYGIKHTLTPIYLEALLHTLKTKSFTRIRVIEVPLFSEESAKIAYGLHNGKNELDVGGIKIVFKRKVDILNFEQVDEDKYKLCALNPGDAHSFPGNEFGYGKAHPSSVESAIGNNTCVRIVQNHILNPAMTDPKNWIGVDLSHNSYRFRFYNPPQSQQAISAPVADTMLKKPSK